MAHTLFQWPFPEMQAGRRSADASSPLRGEVLFRALVEIRSGVVAGIETVQAREVGGDQLSSRRPASPDRILAPDARALLGLGARGDAAYLVRAGLDMRVERIGAAYGVTPGRTILMFDVGELLREPSRALELLVACKRAGARILLDNFDLDTPPARFMEMLPADILRVSPGRMPWHWDEARRGQALREALAFAGNLLMDVAVEDARAESRRTAYKRLGVRYVQGAWRRDDGAGSASPPRLAAEG
ncbi:hypothetical protein [Solidesulfovibrio sp.]|uniref:hypothetical protein n=1 Tax=Solidesulfovibrio sp. TaxID=2910990 RepID=UPI00263440D7|nr:hypothetical protein [Solidesulfovibrio sp.]